jgi:hypothetical protein
MPATECGSRPRNEPRLVIVWRKRPSHCTSAKSCGMWPPHPHCVRPPWRAPLRPDAPVERRHCAKLSKGPRSAGSACECRLRSVVPRCCHRSRFLPSVTRLWLGAEPGIPMSRECVIASPSRTSNRNPAAGKPSGGVLFCHVAGRRLSSTTAPSWALSRDRVVIPLMKSAGAERSKESQRCLAPDDAEHQSGRGAQTRCRCSRSPRRL